MNAGYKKKKEIEKSGKVGNIVEENLNEGNVKFKKFSDCYLQIFLILMCIEI